TYVSNDARNYPRGFEEIARKLTSAGEGRYFFSYCSPKRKGDHTAELEVLAPSGKMARVTYRFNADGFKSGCSPKKAPSLTEESAAAPKSRAQEAAASENGEAASESEAAAGAKEKEDSTPAQKDDARPQRSKDKEEDPQN